MGKIPLVIFSTDKHLNEGNIQEFRDCCQQEIALAKLLRVNTIFWLGDIFDSRIAQRQEVLTAFSEELFNYANNKLSIFCIPGNHDKTDYTKDDSFLTPFKHHPNFYIISKFFTHSIGEWCFNFIPFYEQNRWLEVFEENCSNINGRNQVLCSHIAVEGSKNNDGSLVKSKLTPTLFKNFHSVLLGHYHNAQKIGENIFHIPSTYQQNFGEDPKKGFIIFYDDGSIELQISNFREYRKLKISADQYTDTEIAEFLRENNQSGANIRLEINGTKNRLKSIDKSILSNSKASIVLKETDLEIFSESDKEISTYNFTNLKELYEEFCKENNLNPFEGLSYLNRVCQD